jgi:hypothetical protein
MHPSRLRLGPSQSRSLTDASPGSARSPGLRVCRAAPSRRLNICTHAPFRTECQSFLRCRDMSLRYRASSGRAGPLPLERQRPEVRILSGLPARPAAGAMLKADAIEYAGETTRRPHEGLRSLRPFAALHLSYCEGGQRDKRGGVPFHDAPTYAMRELHESRGNHRRLVRAVVLG